MQKGYIKIWRKATESGWLKNPELWTFWCWCLLKASHKEIDQFVGYQKVHIMPGDFVFGRLKAAKELKTTERKVRTALNSLLTMGNVTIKTTNKYSVISIVNWAIYQGDDSPERPAERPATDQQPTTNKHIRINNNIYTSNFIKFWSAYPNKVSKKAAFKAWEKAKDMPSIEAVLDAIEKQKKWRAEANGEFRPEWKHPATWINQGCWDDVIEIQNSQKGKW